MRGAVVALAVFLLLPAATLPGRGSTSSSTTTLRVALFAPLSVRGAGFRAKERVRVVVQVKGRHVKTVLATATGTFLARFGGVSLPSCTGYLVRATGSQGRRAYLRHVPECPAG